MIVTASRAVLRFMAGDIVAAARLARQAQECTGPSQFLVLDTQLALATIVAVGTDADADVDAFHAELRAYHDTTRHRD